MNESDDGYNTTKNQMIRTGEMCDEAKALDGSYAGYQPKPAVEVILVCMKPLSEKTYVDQALKNGKGISWLMPDCGIPVSSGDSVASVPALSLGSVVASDVNSLLRVCELLRDVPCTTKPCNTICKGRDLREDVLDCSLDKELNQWLSSFPCDDVKCAFAGSSVPDSRCDCPACRRLCDEQSRPSQEDGQDVSTLRPDALAHIVRLLEAHSDSHLKCKCLLSSCDDFLRVVRSYYGNEELPYNDTSNGQDLQRRFPANLLVSNNVLNDGRITKGSANVRHNKASKNNSMSGDNLGHVSRGHADSGSYSRYFSLDSWASTLPFLITPKASKREKNEGLEGEQKNIHSTVKPLKLMAYLITLGSREGDTVLDPFMGSGTTGVACANLKRDFIGMELDPDYFETAKARIENTGKQQSLV